MSSKKYASRFMISVLGTLKWQNNLLVEIRKFVELIWARKKRGEKKFRFLFGVLRSGY